jgi:hypothetical protein
VLWRGKLHTSKPLKSLLLTPYTHETFLTYAEQLQLLACAAVPLQLPNTRRLVEIRSNVLRFPLMPPGPLQTDCDEG